MSDDSRASDAPPVARAVSDAPPAGGSKPRRFYRPELDGLRFFAFLLVFMHHAPSATVLFERHSLPRSIASFLRNFGWCGVDLFLVLSAFLITTLLLMEHEERGRISLRDFYVRRILRIWPLYYLIVSLGFFVLPAAGLFAPPLGSAAYSKLVRDHLFAYYTLFGNFSMGAHGSPSVPTLKHMWTVALEEQFYIVWPALLIVLLRFKRAVVVWTTLGALLALTIGLRFYLIPVSHHPVIWTNTLSRLDPLVLGVGLAFWRRSHTAWGGGAAAALKLLLGLALVGAIGRYPPIQSQSLHVLWQYLATAGGFALVLDAGLAAPPNPVGWLLSRGPLVWLGKVTYGLYVYHVLGLEFGDQLGQQLQRYLGIYSPAGALVLRTATSLALTIVAAALSYTFFESYFLRLKRRFSYVRSGPASEAPPEGGVVVLS